VGEEGESRGKVWGAVGVTCDGRGMGVKGRSERGWGRCAGEEGECEGVEVGGYGGVREGGRGTCSVSGGERGVREGGDVGGEGVLTGGLTGGRGERGVGQGGEKGKGMAGRR